MGRAADEPTHDAAPAKSVPPSVPPLHLVTDDVVLRAPAFAARAEALIAAFGAALALHLRGHGLDGGGLYRVAERLRPAASRSGALLLVNDRVDVAMAAGVDGVQLGRRSLPLPAARRLLGAGARIGYSAHAAEEAAEAARSGADFVVVGTIYATASHPGEPGAGPERVRAAAAASASPVVAIGGITPERVAAVLEAGARGVAVLGGVWRAADPLAAARDYLDALEEGAR